MPIDGPDAADDGILRPGDDPCTPEEPLVLGMMKGPEDWFTPGPGIGFETDDDTLRAPEEHRD
jgi:hypothetical protein